MPTAWAGEPQPPKDKPLYSAYNGWQPKQERVIVIHDLFEMPVATSTLATAFNDAGFKVDNLGYNPLSASKEGILPAMLNDLYDRMRHYSDKDEQTVHFVCHGLGCVLAHGLIYEHRPQKLGYVLAIGAPYYMKWLVEGRDVKGWVLSSDRLGANTPNRLKLEEYFAHPITYDAAALTGTRMTYPQRTDTVFDLGGKTHADMQFHAPAYNGAVDLRVLPADQNTLITDADVLAEAVYYIEHGTFRPLP